VEREFRNPAYISAASESGGVVSGISASAESNGT
jgi:hypothetical protein